MACHFIWTNYKHFTKGCFAQSFFFFLICPVVLKKIFESMLFEQYWIPFTEGCVVPSLVEICPVILEKIKMWKVYEKTDLQTDDRRSENLTSFQLKLANSSEKFKLQSVNTYHFFSSFKLISNCYSC